MKTLISTILLVSLLVNSAQAYDYGAELIKMLKCTDEQDAAKIACKADTACNAARTVYSSCTDSDADITKASTDL